MALEKIRNFHPNLAKVVKEAQGYELDLFAAETENGIFAAVSGMEPEDTLRAVIEDSTATAVKRAVANFSIWDGKASCHFAFTTVIATDIVIINGLTYTGVAGVKANNTEWSVDTSDTVAAADLVASINSRDPTNVAAFADGAGLVVKAFASGAAGNAIAVSEPDTTIALTTNNAGFLGDGNGDDATGTLTCASVIATDTATVNGHLYTAVAVADDNVNDPSIFSIGVSDATCAQSLRDKINLRELGKDTIVASTSTNVTTVTTTTIGVAGNAITLAETGGTITLSGAVLTGGTAIGGGLVSNPGTTPLLAGTAMLMWINKK